MQSGSPGDLEAAGDDPFPKIMNSGIVSLQPHGPGPAPESVLTDTMMDPGTMGAKCTLAPLRDTADCSPADVSPVTYPDLADRSLANFAPTTLRNSVNPSPAYVFKRQCLTGSTHHPSDLITSARLLSTQGGLRTSWVLPFHIPPHRTPGDWLQMELWLMCVPLPFLVCWVPFVTCRAGAYGRLTLVTHARMLTGGLVTCDWLRPVTHGRGSSNQSSDAHYCQLPRMQWLVDMSLDRLGLSQISWSFAAGLGTCADCLDSLVVLSDGIALLLVVDLYDCSGLPVCVAMSA